MTLLIVSIASIAIVLGLEKFPAGRLFLKAIAEPCRTGTCRSFILDFGLLLPLVGLLVEYLSRKFQNRQARACLYAIAIGMFLTISGSLYLDRLTLSFLVPYLGHPGAWGGNHFMWNSGIEVLGLKPIFSRTLPTYIPFWGPWNILALAFFGLYPLVMVKAGTRLRGILREYRKK